MSEIDGITTDVCAAGVESADKLVHKYLDVSTGCLPEAEFNALTTHEWVVTEPTQYGAWVWVRPANDMDTIPTDLPHLTRLMDVARELGCRWILLDSDAYAVEGLPFFEW